MTYGKLSDAIKKSILAKGKSKAKKETTPFPPKKVAPRSPAVVS